MDRHFPITLKNDRSGFTLIELLVTVFILGLFMSIAVAMWQTAIDDSSKKQCRNLLQALANAEDQYKLSNVQTITLNAITLPGRFYYPTPASWTGVSTTTSTDLVPLKPYIGTLPLCPSGGSLSVSVRTDFSNGSGLKGQALTVACSLHGSFRPGVDTY